MMRPKGMVNGNGLTNGFINGNGVTNGNKPSVGKVNGCTNGVTNGLVNGNGRSLKSDNGTSPIKKSRKRNPLVTMSVIGVVLLILSTVYFFYPEPAPIQEPIHIDGSFEDWETRDGLLDSSRFHYLSSEVPCNARSKQLVVVYVLVDSDLDANTGYYFGDQGSDYFVAFSCGNGTIDSTRSGTFQGREYDHFDLSGFSSNGNSRVAVTDERFELAISRFDLKHNETEEIGAVIVHVLHPNGLVKVTRYGDVTSPKPRAFDDPSEVDGIRIDGAFEDWEGKPERVDGAMTHLHLETDAEVLSGGLPITRDERLPLPKDNNESIPSGNVTYTHEKRSLKDGRDRVLITFDNGDILEVLGQSGLVSSSTLYTEDGEVTVPASVSGTDLEIRLPRRDDGYTVEVLDWHGEDKTRGQRSRTRTVFGANINDYGTRDVLGNIIYFFRDIGTTETDCNILNMEMSMIAGIGGRAVNLPLVADTACWYAPIGPTSIPSGDWDITLDLGEGGGGGPTRAGTTIEIWDFNFNVIIETIGTCTGIDPPILEYQCLIPLVSQKTIGFNEGIRVTVYKESGTRYPIVQYEGPPLGNFDSRCSIPIPEFEEVVTALIIFCAIAIPIVRRRWQE